MSRTSKTNEPAYRMAVVANNFHIPFHDERSVKLLLLFLKREKPDWLVINGNFFGFQGIARPHRAANGGDTLSECIQECRKILARFRRYLPRSRITWVEGSQEFRLRGSLLRLAKRFHGSKSVRKLFGLAEWRIEYVRCPRTSVRFSENYIQIAGLYVGQWDKISKHAGYGAKALVDEKGVNILQGHTKRFGVHCRRLIDGRILVGLENFCLCSMDRTFPAQPNWHQGFSVVYYQPSSRRFHVHPILIRENRFVWNGRLYTLERDTRLARQ